MIMTKREKIIYWVATIWLALGMTTTGLLQIIQFEEQLEVMRHLGYPDYFSSILGTWKVLGVIAILVPGYPLIKEWAYAGYFFAMSGAIVSHVVAEDPASEFIGSSLLVVLTIVSWYFRPDSRTLRAR
ncbi:MAG: DoxX family protein [Salibacteraceae bacterium]